MRNKCHGLAEFEIQRKSRHRGCANARVEIWHGNVGEQHVRASPGEVMANKIRSDRTGVEMLLALVCYIPIMLQKDNFN